MPARGPCALYPFVGISIPGDPDIIHPVIVLCRPPCTVSGVEMVPRGIFNRWDSSARVSASAGTGFRTRRDHCWL
jgi:hypothetical protein